MSERWSVGDPREDYERDAAHEDSAERMLFESGADVSKWHWCAQLRRMRLRADPQCGQCPGDGVQCRRG